MIAIVDYGVGNLFSLQSSFAAIGQQVRVSANPEELLAAERVVLPGVGAFGDAMARLRDSGLADVVRQVAAKGTPLLGICLGMQLLFEKSFEFGEHAGLGLLEGEIRSLEEALQKAKFPYKVPHMGWNPLHAFKTDSPMVKYIREGDAVYYVHSYYAANAAKSHVAGSEYGIEIPGIVEKGNVFGTQFHPEKSGKVGLAVLRAFAEVEAC